VSRRFVFNLTKAREDGDRATVAFVLANAAIASEKEVIVFLNVEGVHLSQTGYADDIHEAGFAPLKDLISSFVEAGGKIYVCSPCFKKRGLDENNLIPGATIVGGATLVEYMSADCVSLSY
jgi:uncharacterized protein